MNFAVIGGDLRSVYLVKRLLRDGHQVRCCGLDTIALPGACKYQALQDVMEDADCVVLPTPAMDDAMLRTPLSAQKYTAEEVAEVLRWDVPVFAGAPGPVLTELCRQRKITLIDLLSLESLTLKNAALTAECAVGLLIQNVPYALSGEPILILGAGRIGRQVAEKLRGLGAQVTVIARNLRDRAWCADQGLHAADFCALPSLLPGFRLAINTIPARVLPTELLEILPEGAHLVELASKPGGFDPTTAERLGLQVIRGGGLPGRLAPESAADAIAETIYSMIER